MIAFKKSTIGKVSVLALALSVASYALPSLAADENTPSLDLAPTTVETGLTPISALTNQVDPQEVEKSSAKPATTKTVKKNEAKAPVESEIKMGIKPAVLNVVLNKAKFWEDASIKPVSYTPLPAIVIFPVLKHGNEKAFGDLPLIFSREFSQRMELKVPETTKVFHPIYTVDELRLRGLGHVYDKIMDYYVKAGRPEPLAMDYLLKQLSADGRTISRVIFVEADLDMTHVADPSGIFDRVNAVFTDATPREMKYHVRSRIQAFDSESSEFPMVWGWTWSKSVKANHMMNVTPSVYMDSDSQQTFAKVSRMMSREILVALPQKVYMEPHYDISVQGQLVSKKDISSVKDVNIPASIETEAFSAEPLSLENRQAIDRILKHQNISNP